MNNLEKYKLKDNLIDFARQAYPLIQMMGTGCEQLSEDKIDSLRKYYPEFLEINNFRDEERLEILSERGICILFVIFPTEKEQLAAIIQDPISYKVIPYPSDNVKLLAKLSL